jgi:tetratricopeptide (TPR) repeat protein
MSKERSNPILYSYLKKYQEDPNSRVFAPLAEAYRKVNRIDEAIEIAREGLKIHPGFIGGRVALARALFDKQLYDEVIEELKPVIRDAPDNLVAQRLVADSYLIQGQVADALGAYKMLLYFAPQDLEAAQLVQELESEAYESGVLVLRNDPKPETVAQFNVQSAQNAFDQDLAVRKARWIRRVEFLQSLLQKVERYRAHVSKLEP